MKIKSVHLVELYRVAQKVSHYQMIKNRIKGVILTGQTRLRFGSVWFSSVHFGTCAVKISRPTFHFGSIWRLLT